MTIMTAGSQVPSEQILDLVQLKAPNIWLTFKGEETDSEIAAYLICQILSLYTEGAREGINLEPFQEYTEVTGADVAGLKIANPKARVFVGKNCKFERSIISGTNEAYIFIGQDAVLTGCEIACHAKKNVVAIGFNCRLEGVFTHIHNQHGFVVLAPGVTMQSECNLCVQENSCLIVGSDSMLSTHVVIRTSDSHGIYDLETRSRVNPTRPTIIHPHVWISRAATLNKGTEIGTHSVVEQNAVAHGRLLAHSIYAGSPVQVVRSGVTWDRRSAESLDEDHNRLRNHFLATFLANVSRRVFDDPHEDYGLLAALSLAIAGRPSALLRGISVGSDLEKDLLVQFSTLRPLVLEHGALARRRLSGSEARPKEGESRVALLMMQKDEASLLRPWLEYHGSQFGLENLFVWDNGSTDPTVLSTLHQYEKLGLNVDYSAQSGVDFRRKGVLLGNKIRELERTGAYDFLVPIDCDELFALERDVGDVSVDRDEILRALAEYQDVEAPLGISVAYNNMLGKLDEFVRVPHQKSLFRSGTFKIMDHGYHMGESLLTSSKIQTKLTYLHFHHKPYKILLEHSKNKLRPYLDVEDLDLLKSIAGKNRLAAFILEGEAAYMARFDRKDTLRLAGMADRLTEIGVASSRDLWLAGART